MFDTTPTLADLNAVSTLRCRGCARAESCLGAALDGAIPNRRGEALPSVDTFSRGKHLHSADDKVEHLYVVRSGAVKSYQLTADGEEQIMGFHLPGDVVGIDAITTGTFQSSAVAITSTEVCRLPATAIHGRAAESPAFRQTILSSVGREIRRLHRLLYLERCTSEQRLAAFLLGHARKLPKAGGNRLTVTLPMSRADIGKFLDMATETVSRMFSKLHAAGIIAVHGAEIELIKLNALQQYVSSAQQTMAGHSKVH
jgi:CRP/FNR family transcriptional regulator